MCVLAPGWLEHFFHNEHYANDEQYLTRTICGRSDRLCSRSSSAAKTRSRAPTAAWDFAYTRRLPGKLKALAEGAALASKALWR